MEGGAHEEFEGGGVGDESLPLILVLEVAFASAVPVGDHSGAVVEDEVMLLRVIGQLYHHERVVRGRRHEKETDHPNKEDDQEGG